MIIDSHIHISIITRGGSFELAKQKLLGEMRKNKVVRAIVIPDNVPNPQCADLNTVTELIKNEPKLSILATL